MIKNVLNSRYFIWVIIALPSLFMLNGYLRGNTVYGNLMHASGEFSARLLVLSLIISPFRLMFPSRRWPGWLMQRDGEPWILGIEATSAVAILQGDGAKPFLNGLNVQHWCDL